MSSYLAGRLGCYAYGPGSYDDEYGGGWYTCSKCGQLCGGDPCGDCIANAARADSLKTRNDQAASQDRPEPRP